MIRWICQGFESFRINKTLKHVIDLVIPFPVLNPSVLTRLSNYWLYTYFITRVLNPSVLTRLSNTLAVWQEGKAVLNPSVLTRLSNAYSINGYDSGVLNPSVLTRLSNLKSGSHRALPSNDRWLLI